jgi:Holliday junction DNA helicase RuvB
MPDEDRVVSGKKRPDEPINVDAALRPRTLDEIYGQETLVENLRILIEAAKGREEALDHILFYGPPGLGKTSMSHVLAHEMSVNIRVTAGPVIERAGDLAAILTNLRKGDILFIDEVHRLGRAVEEILYPAMEDYALDILVGKGPTARSIRLKLPRYTVIGATTRLALMTAPLRARFGAMFRLDFYGEEALRKIIKRAADLLDMPIDDEGAAEIARRSRGTPRVSLRLLRRVRDYAQVRADGTITAEVARDAAELLAIDELGLDDIDRRVLETIITKFGGGPVGLETIAAAISEEADTIMDVYEPYLLQLGFLERTSRGRLATGLAYQHLGYEDNRADQPRLF